MAATLFDHITQITNVQNPKYWDTLDESDRKTWSNYMVLRFLSMKYEWVETIATVQPYLQATKSGKERIIQLCEDYGTDPKEIKKLKIKVW
jgi:hypothetical protein